MEVIVLSIPVICFIVFVHHVQGKHFAVKENDELMTKELMTNSEEEGVKLKFWRAYVVMNITRAMIGSIMLYAYFHIYVFQMYMPQAYVCDRSPCQYLTTCYIGK